MVSWTTDPWAADKKVGLGSLYGLVSSLVQKEIWSNQILLLGVYTKQDSDTTHDSGLYMLLTKPVLVKW